MSSESYRASSAFARRSVPIQSRSYLLVTENRPPRLQMDSIIDLKVNESTWTPISITDPDGDTYNFTLNINGDEQAVEHFINETGFRSVMFTSMNDGGV